MPVRLESRRSRRDHKMDAAWRRAQSASSVPLDRSRCITIGLVNNMPHAAFKATERQFISLLNDASGDLPIFLSLHVLPGSDDHEASGYSSTEALYEKRFDGLIVTGRESQKPNLKDESYWQNFTTLVDWARDNTSSSIWSCLAAHAAVLHLDGVERHRKQEKCSGIFKCVCEHKHFLTTGTGRHVQVPHSRWNGLVEQELVEHGYKTLVRTADKEPDAFIKHENSLMIFLQGHPEYECDTLVREYRRDVGRYLRGEAKSYPSIPSGCFNATAEKALTLIQEQATSSRNRDLLQDVAALLDENAIVNTWQSHATLIYKNWLQYLWSQKGGRQPHAHIADTSAAQLRFASSSVQASLLAAPGDQLEIDVASLAAGAVHP